MYIIEFGDLALDGGREGNGQRAVGDGHELIAHDDEFIRHGGDLVNKRDAFDHDFMRAGGKQGFSSHHGDQIVPIRQVIPPRRIIGEDIRIQPLIRILIPVALIEGILPASQPYPRTAS